MPLVGRSDPPSNGVGAPHLASGYPKKTKWMGEGWALQQQELRRLGIAEPAYCKRRSRSTTFSVDFRGRYSHACGMKPWQVGILIVLVRCV